MMDIIVIGGGPAGVSLGVEARQAGIDHVVILEKGDGHNHTIRRLYTEGKRIDAVWKGVAAKAEGVLELDAGDRESYLARMDDTIERYKLDIRYSSEVSSIRLVEDGSFVVTSGGVPLSSAAVVIAIGVMGRPNKPDYKIPASLRACVHFELPAERPTGKRLLVVGGGDSASEAVQYLAQGNSVVLSYRGAEFRRMNAINRGSLEDLTSAGRAELWKPTSIVAVEATDDGLCRIRLDEPTHDGAEFDGVYYCLGGASPTHFLQAVGLEFKSKYPDVNEETLETEIPGLYLAGDLAHQGKGSITTALNSGYRIVRKGLCIDRFKCDPEQP